MLNSVSFRSGATESARDIIGQPQKNARTQTVQPQVDMQAAPAKKKSNKVLKAIAGTVAAAIVVAGGLAAGKHFGAFDKLIAMGAKEGAGNVAKWAGKAGEYMNTAGEWLVANGKKAWGAIAGLFKKGGEAVAEGAEAVA